MSRWFTVLMICLAFTLVFSGCGKDKEKGNDSTKANTKIEGNNAEIEVAGDLKDSVELPGDYPSDVFPVYEDSFIASAANDEDGTFVLICYVDESIKEVGEYYKEVIKDAREMTTEDEADHYMSMGDIGDYTYTIEVCEADEDMGYKTMYNISLVPGNMFDQMEGMMPESGDIPGSGGNQPEEEEEPEEEAKEEPADYTIPDGIDFPDDYPQEVFPIYAEGETEIAASEQMGERQIVGFATEDSFQDVLAYYTEKFSATEGYSLEQQGPTIVIKGSSQGYDYEILITSNDGNMGVDAKFKTLGQISY